VAQGERVRTREAPRRSRGTVTTSEVNVQPVGQAGSQDSGGGLKGTIKKHPYATSAVAALGVSAAYLLYKHFKSSSSAAATTTGSTTSGFPLNTGTGTRHGGGAGSAGGSGSGGGSSGSGSNGAGAPGSVDLSGLTGLFQGLQSELAMLGQEISGLNSTSTSGSSGGGGGAVKALPYSALPGVQPANTLPANAKTVNVQVGGGTYQVPYTGATPSPVITTLIGQTAAANAGIPTNGITASDIAAARSSVAAGAGQQAPQNPVVRANPAPVPSKAVAAAPSPAANQHVNSSPASVNAQAPKAQAVTNTQAAHAQQTAKAAAKPAVAQPAAGHTGISR
jgi:hypothetical protein